MSSAEWMADYRERMRQEEPEKYEKVLAEASAREKRKSRAKHQARLIELASDAGASARYLASRRGGLAARGRSGRKRKYRRDFDF